MSEHIVTPHDKLVERVLKCAKPAEPQAVPIPFDWAQPCEWCDGKTVVDSGGTTPRGEAIAVRCGYCAGTGLAHPAQRVLHLEAQLRDAERTLAKREAMLDEAARLEMQRACEIEDAEQKGWNEAIEAAAKLFEANFPIGGRGGFAIRALARGPVQGEQS